MEWLTLKPSYLQETSFGMSSGRDTRKSVVMEQTGPMILLEMNEPTLKTAQSYPIWNQSNGQSEKCPEIQLWMSNRLLDEEIFHPEGQS